MKWTPLDVTVAAVQSELVPADVTFEPTIVAVVPDTEMVPLLTDGGVSEQFSINSTL